MTPHGIVTRATFADAYELDAKLRPEDRKEVEDITGKPAIRNFLMGVVIGEPCLTLRDPEGELLGILGVVPVGVSGGSIALSGTALLEQRRTCFLRGTIDVLAELDRSYDTLFNVCDARNPVHHRWLKWAGFNFIRKIDRFGAKGVPVIEFARIRQIV
ncbi:hypothetical protein V6R85_02495 [Agrobacterium sp. CCNWLW32]|uniref:hypothetical protein n=1 Tax=Agrobacterium sp. CCNWLW32 TaxID=3122072 RepID=UPI000458CD1B|nr:hypothetical protein AWN88_25620 [Agrobacterium tumefaciens]KAJ36281.1 hypothetical protein BW45_23020 [Agrobacterium tumefaciens]